MNTSQKQQLINEIRTIVKRVLKEETFTFNDFNDDYSKSWVLEPFKTAIKVKNIDISTNDKWNDLVTLNKDELKKLLDIDDKLANTLYNTFYSSLTDEQKKYYIIKNLIQLKVE